VRTGPNGHSPVHASRRSVATYEYKDEAGDLLFEVIRYEPKAFRQRRPDGRGGWIYDTKGVRRVLYRLPALTGQERVFVLEGEKDVDTLWAEGVPATTSPGGAGHWNDDYASLLRAAGVKTVVIIPDNDRAGVKHGAAVERSCRAAGLTAFTVLLPGLPPVRDKHGQDVSDWLQAGHTVAELEAVVEAAVAAPRPLPALSRKDATTGVLTFTSLQDLLAEPEEECAWLVDGRLPAAGFSVLAGKPKAGKSTAARCLALAVARGEPWLGFPTHQAQPVLYLGLEEKRAEVRKHFEAMGGGPGDPIHLYTTAAPPDGLAQLRVAAERHRPGLIIVDPLLRFIRVKDANDYASVTAALEPLLMLARGTGAHVLTVHHMSKGDRSGGDSILGSTALFGAVDTALLLKRSDRYRTLSSIQRYGMDLEEVVLELDPVTRIVTAGVSRREAEETGAEEAILDFLLAQAEEVDEASIHEGVEGRKGEKARALRRLVKKDRVGRTGPGRRGAPYLYAVSSSLVPVSSAEPEKPETKNRGKYASERDLFWFQKKWCSAEGWRLAGTGIASRRRGRSMTPAEVLAEVVKAGGSVVPDPTRPRLRVPAALKPLVLEHREALRAAVGEIAAVVSMPLPIYAREGQPLEVRVPWWPQTLWFVPDETHAHALEFEGVSRGRIWTAAELINVVALDNDQATQLVAIAKREFAGVVVEVRPHA
jgi:hypothetical protein